MAPTFAVASSGFGTTVAGLGNFSNVVPPIPYDFAVRASSTSVEVRHLLNFVAMTTTDAAGVDFGASIAVIPNFKLGAGAAAPAIAIGDPAWNNNTGRVQIYRYNVGTNLPPIATITGTSAGDLLGKSLASGGDISGTGSDDLLIGAATYARIYEGQIGVHPRDVMVTGFVSSVAVIGDSNGDGYDDFVIGDQTASAAFLCFGGPIASVAPLGAPCLGGILTASSLPIPGTTVTFALNGASGNSPSSLYIGQPDPVGTPIGGCTPLHLLINPALGSVFSAWTTATGSWPAPGGPTVPVPTAMGFRLGFQAITVAGVGFELPDGLDLTVGW